MGLAPGCLWSLADCSGKGREELDQQEVAGASSQAPVLQPIWTYLAGFLLRVPKLVRMDPHTRHVQAATCCQATLDNFPCLCFRPPC